jgi:hypothetical protein
LQRGELQDQEVYDLLERCWRAMRPGPDRSKVEAALQQLQQRIDLERRRANDPDVGPPTPPGN